MASGGETGFTASVTGEDGLAEEVNQIIAAWQGTTDRGVPLDLTEVEHTTQYALDVRNKDTTSSLVARFRNAANENLLTLVKEAVTIGKPATFSGTATFVGAVTLPNRTRKFLVQVIGAYNGTDSTNIERGYLARGWPLTDAKLCYGVGRFFVPSDYVSDLTIQAVVITIGSGDIYGRLRTWAGAEGEDYDNHSGATGWAASALSEATITLIWSIVPSGLAAGDYVPIRLERDAANAADTVDDIVYLMGFLVAYTADS